MKKGIITTSGRTIVSTIQKTPAAIRELRHEELDLVGGANSVETSMQLSCSARSVCSATGCFNIHVPDDHVVDLTYD